MAWPRHSAPIRALTLLVLVWVGFDLGAHGFFASDFEPIAPGGSAIRVSVDDSRATTPPAPDHCFCHSISVGAVSPAPSSGLTPAGMFVLVLSPRVPRSHPHPFDRPPRFPA
jgi:hypothetical protein